MEGLDILHHKLDVDKIYLKTHRSHYCKHLQTPARKAVEELGQQDGERHCPGDICPSLDEEWETATKTVLEVDAYEGAHSKDDEEEP